MSREQQDVQSFADSNLQHELYRSKWRVKIINRAINVIKKTNRSTALIGSFTMVLVKFSAASSNTEET